MYGNAAKQEPNECETLNGVGVERESVFTKTLCVHKHSRVREYEERYYRGKKGLQLSAGPVLASNVADKGSTQRIHCDL